MDPETETTHKKELMLLAAGALTTLYALRLEADGRSPLIQEEMETLCRRIEDEFFAPASSGDEGPS